MPNLRRKQKMHRGRVGLEISRSRDILAEEIVIVVIEPGEIDIEVLAQQTAVAQFVAIELFRSEVGIGVEAREIRRSVRQCLDVA